MRFDFITEYLPGSQLYPADTLSRFPLPVQPDLIDTSEIIECYVSTVIDALPLSDVMIDYVHSATATDDALQRVITFCYTSWPNNLSHLAPDLQQYWHSCDRLTVQDGLVLYDTRIVIQKAIRHTTLEAFLSGHLGITKCRAKARSAI